MNTRVIAAIVAAAVLTGCGGRGTTVTDDRDAALGAEFEGLVSKLAAADEFSDVHRSLQSANDKERPDRRSDIQVSDWNAGQYLKFEDERTRPAVDLLNRVPLERARRCVDLGCGPGNSTVLLAERFADAVISGLDSSPGMVATARERLPALAFEQGDISTWHPKERFDLIFANAVLHWVPDHAELLHRLVGFLTPGGCLAVQVPDNEEEPSHRVMLDVAQAGPWAGRLGSAADAREPIAAIEAYYGWLLEAGCRVDIWRTTYVHPLDGASAIVEWFTSTGLKPFLDALDPHERSAFLARYEAGIAAAYPAQADGKVLLRFPRLFLVAQRT